ncbi:MAG: hypothetical protein CMI18_03615 [Opitutaceae bacterium]|nr:hypothetical protein [Opitutaceae bacterium]|tara:strand:- start:655 stop:894 length:240 start_codon:yes stop_codon:yes gene_type:complete
MEIYPENPNGEPITYFEFENGVPGWGYVVVVARDGSNPRYVKERVLGGDHDGTRQQWIDNDQLIYGVENEAFNHRKHKG